MQNKIALSVDVEDWFHGLHVVSTDISPIKRVKEFRAQHRYIRGKIEKPLRDLLDLYAQSQIKATFFIVAELVEVYPALFREIILEGHEIACHGLHHIEYRGLGNQKEVNLFRKNISQAKRILEDQLGTNIIGFRAPSAYFRDWMVTLLLELGFRYDSSIAVNSLYNKMTNLKLPSARAPFYWKNCKTTYPLLEIPWPYWSFFGFKFPAGGGPALRFLGPLITKLGLKQTLRKNDTSLYIHPLDISDLPLPKVIVDNRKHFWRNKGKKTYDWYKKLLRHFNGLFIPCKDVLNRIESHKE